MCIDFLELPGTKVLCFSAQDKKTIVAIWIF